MTIKLTSDKSAVVDDEYYWNEDFTSCPRGGKVQLLNPSGVAVYGTIGSDYKSWGWLAWAPLPKRRSK